MTSLKENQDAYNKQFGSWAKTLKAAGVDTVEALFTKIHAAIRANPDRKSGPARKSTPQTYDDALKTVIVTKNGKYTRERKLTRAQRQANLQQKIQDAIARMGDN